jgi:anti-sigma factor RsiW
VLEININISNYEEYLLSAVDGELSGDEMVALEAFLQQYPHIREELTLLESVRLTPDPEVLFDDKAQLYRQSNVLSAANYESQLLDYIDNELHGPEKQAFELLIQQHPHILQELNILKQTRLQPDLSLQFENKAVLYRNNRTKVRPIWWWSAAAALVAGVAVFISVPQLKTAQSVQVAVKTNNINTAVPPVSAPSVPVTTAPAPDVASNVPAEKNTVNKQSPVKSEQTVNTPKQKTGNQLLATNKALPVPTVPVTDKQQPAPDNSNATAGLTKLAPPAATSGEIVKQLEDKINEQKIAALQQAPVMANATTTTGTTNKVSEAVKTAAPVQGELVVSVTMNGDSKLLNGVANVARFFSKKKK